MRRRHDPFLKILYRAGARDAVTLFFLELAARIDWEALQWIDKEVPIRGERPRAIVADLVGLTRDVEGRYMKVLLHPEIQMLVPADMGWRVLQYNAGLLLREADPDARVLTFVFYHCAGVGGVQEQSHRLEFYDRTVHEVGYWSVGLGDLEAEAYAESQNPMAWALAAWMRQRREDRVELRLRLVEKLLRLVRDESYRRLLLDTVRTYFRLNRAEQAEEQRLLQSGIYGEVNEMLHTELGRLEERARREGEERARQQMQTELGRMEERARREGMREGEERARQQTLVDILEARFSQVPGPIADRIQKLQDLTVLQELIRRAAVASNLEEVEALLPS
jgi:hypothetical protein